MADNVTLDITGFYYSVKVDLEQFDRSERREVSVQDVTRAAVGKIGESGGRLIEATFSDSGFLNKLTVEHVRPPKSRQTGAGGLRERRPASLPAGIYSYSDEFLRSVGDEPIKVTPVWQYYVFDITGDLRTGSTRARDLIRTITPSAESDREVRLRQGYLIRWRLVGIAGLQNEAEQLISSLPTAERQEVEQEIAAGAMGVRDVISLISNRM